jgi:hypothetical protein
MGHGGLHRGAIVAEDGFSGETVARAVKCDQPSTPNEAWRSTLRNDLLRCKPAASRKPLSRLHLRRGIARVRYMHG